MSFSSRLCVRIQFPVLDPRLFSPVGRQLVWQSWARSGSAGSAGVRGRGGLPWPGRRSSAWGRVRVTGGSERSCESWRDGLPWLSSSPRCTQAVLSLASATGSSQEQNANPFFIGLKRLLWWAGPRLPSLFDPPLLRQLFASSRWHSLIPQVPWGGLSPDKGHSQVRAPPLGPAQGWALPPAQEQLVRACLVLTMCLPGEIFVFHPTTSLRECSFLECPPTFPEGTIADFPRQSWQFWAPWNNHQGGRHPPMPQHRRAHTEVVQSASLHHVVSGFHGWALENIYPSFCAPQERSRNWLRENK